MQSKWLWATAFLIILGACNRSGSDCKNEGPEVKTPVKVKITRLESEIADADTEAKARALLARHPLFAEGYFFSMPGADTATILKLMVDGAKDPYLDTMSQDVNQQFPDLAGMEAGLSELFSNVKAYYPAFIPPRVYTMASGFSVDIFHQDSLLLIGLEHFTDDRARYESPGIPRYIRVRMRPWTVVPAVAKVLSEPYNPTLRGENGQRVLDAMINWGKTYYFIENVLPCIQDSTLIGYTAQDLQDLKDQAVQSKIKSYFSGKVLYQDSPLVVNKLTGERPNTLEIGDKAPGRLGQWMGWQIVRKWAHDKDLTLPEVMAEISADKIYQEANWRPVGE